MKTEVERGEEKRRRGRKREEREGIYEERQRKRGERGR